MKKELFSLLLTITLATCLPGYSMENKKSYTQQENANIDTILDSPEFLKDLEEGKHSEAFFCLIQRAIEEDRMQETNALLKYLKTSPHFRRNARNFTSTLMFAIKNNNKPLIKAILFHPEFKEIYDFTPPSPAFCSPSYRKKLRSPNYQPPPTFKQILNDAITKKNEFVTKTILECLEDTFTNPCTWDICYTILTYAEKPEHAWIISLIPQKKFLHPHNIQELLIRAIINKNDFIIKPILNHLEFYPSYIIEEILKYLNDPKFEPKTPTDILIYAIKNQKEPLIKIMLKFLEHNPRFKPKDFKSIIKAAIKYEYDYVVETILKILEGIELQTEPYLNIRADILALGIKHKKEYIIETMLKYLEEIKPSCKLEAILKHTIEHRNDLIIKRILEHPNFKPNDLSNILMRAIKYDNEFVIEELSKHSLFKVSLNLDKIKKILYRALRYKNSLQSKFY